MISIDRLKEMAIEELQTELKNFKEQIKLQNNFIDSLLKATNNSEWLDKSMLDDEVSKVIEKIELDYAQLDQLKAENEELKRRITKIFACLINANRADKIIDTLWIGDIMTLWDYIAQTLEIKGDQLQIEEQILQKISEVVDG